MVLKKKVTAAVLAGVLATAVVPMGLTASAASSGDVQVQYIAGALVPDDGDGTYYVTIPSNVLFSGESDAHDMNVNLMEVDTSKDLDPALEVTVHVYSTNDYTLKNDNYTASGTYSLVYNSDTMVNAQTGQGETGKTDVATNGDQVGVLTPTSTTLSGTATMTAEPTVDTQGVSFTDTLTYYVEETASSNP